jgi:hypothetical protein
MNREKSEHEEGKAIKDIIYSLFMEFSKYEFSCQVSQRNMLTPNLTL